MLQQVYGDITMSCTHVFEWRKWSKVGLEEVKDDSRRRKPSINRTEVNVEWVRQQVVVIVGWVFEWSQVSLTRKRPVFGRLSLKISACLESKETPDSCWPSETSPYWNNLHIPIILLCVNFFFSPGQEDHQGTCFEGVETIKRVVRME